MKKYKSGWILAAILASTLLSGVAEAAKGLDLNLDYSLSFHESINSASGSLTRNVVQTGVLPRNLAIIVVAEAAKGFGLNLDRNVNFNKSNNASLNRLYRNDARPLVWSRSSALMANTQNFWNAEDSFKPGRLWVPVSIRSAGNLMLSEFFSIPSFGGVIFNNAGNMVMSRISSVTGDGHDSWLSASSGSWSSESSSGVWSFEFITHPLAGVVAVPEPETYAMLLSGLGLLGFVARRRKNSGK